MIEIVPPKKLNATVTVPGSKYLANRILILAALADGTSTLHNVPQNDDIDAALNALQTLGIAMKISGSTVQITGGNGTFTPKKNEIDVRESGTLMRFITGCAVLALERITITGSARIQQRPIQDLIRCLEDLGVPSHASASGCPPVTLQKGTFHGGATTIRGDISSQFISTLLMIAPYAEKGVDISISTPLSSREYVDMTITLMKQFGVTVLREGYTRFQVTAGQQYGAQECTVSGDWSSANYFFAAAALLSSTITVRGLDTGAGQEAHFVDVLARMGCTVHKDEGSVTVSGPKQLTGISVDMSAMPDSVQTLAVIAPFARSPTTIQNIQNLRFKESDRIHDTAAELKKLGISVTTDDGEMTISPGRVTGGIIDPHNDHRMAMSFSLIGLKVPGIIIKDPDCVNKSFPQFWDMMKEIGVGIQDAR